MQAPEQLSTAMDKFRRIGAKQNAQKALDANQRLGAV
jgi:hypothetical protein